jgi:hypothetical protein
MMYHGIALRRRGWNKPRSIKFMAVATFALIILCFLLAHSLSRLDGLHRGIPMSQSEKEDINKRVMANYRHGVDIFVAKIKSGGVK